ncbi:MAG: Hpt domain-containing protein [Acidobacteriota bacterium]|nr:Hpt domain-containing protein [Blastocatellia bacterium]MDW8412362.1 Hpt domain-containing protein [Acidobacteriota bacterium]
MSNASDSPKIVDREVLRELCQLEGEEGQDFLTELFEIFKQTATEDINKLEAAIAAREAMQIYRLAHKLKGSCLPLGANRLSVVCASLEKEAKEGRIDEAVQFLEKIKEEYKILLQHFKEEFGI